MTEEEITRVLADMGQPAFRGKQVFTWLHRGVRSFDEMSNLSKPLRQQLAQAYTISVPTVARKQESRLDGTIKYLWELPDGNCIETVLMQYHHGNTVCISSQVGCRMGCAFCASTVAGKVRDLTAGEMLDQVLFTQLDSGREISNIVLMGIGEPLDNRDNVLRFLRLVNHPDGLNIGMRHISLSTCGVVPGIDALAEEDLQLTLSVSLHAPDSETRSRIMPVNRAWDVEELFAACHRSQLKKGWVPAYSRAISRMLAWGKKYQSSGIAAMRPFTAGFSYIGWPSRVISPLSGRYMPVKCRMMVDFPAPLGPTRPYTAPWGTVMLTPSRARKPSKVFTTFFASSIAVPSFPKVRPFLPGHAQVPQLLHQGLHPGGDLRPPLPVLFPDLADEGAPA